MFDESVHGFAEEGGSEYCEELAGGGHCYRTNDFGETEVMKK